MKRLARQEIFEWIFWWWFGVVLWLTASIFLDGCASASAKDKGCEVIARVTDESAYVITYINERAAMHDVPEDVIDHTIDMAEIIEEFFHMCFEDKGEA